MEFDFAKTYELEFIAGRDFDASNMADSSSVILNEAAVKVLNQPIEKMIGSTVVERYYNFALQQQPTSALLKLLVSLKTFLISRCTRRSSL